MPAKDMIRYMVEHCALPQAVYETGLALSFQLMVSPGKTMLQFYRAFLEADTSVPVLEEDFKESSNVYEYGDDRLLVLRLGMPEATETYHCRAVYVCFSKLAGKRFYFTSERDDNGDYLLCAWAKDHTHLNFGYAPKDELSEIQLVSQLFWEVDSDGYKERIEGLRAG